MMRRSTAYIAKQLHRQVFLLAVGMVCLLLAVGCNEKGTGPPVTFQIINVKVTPNPVASFYTAILNIQLTDSLEESHRIVWRLQRPDNSYKDTLIENSHFYWQAPEQIGEYTHEVWVETEEGEAISNVQSVTITVMSSRWSPEDPFYIEANLLYHRSGNLYLMDTNTGETCSLGEGDVPRWSPDGERIIYNGPIEERQTTQILMMYADATERRVVSLRNQNGRIEPAVNASFNPIWSPSGQEVAYSRCNNCEAGGANFEIYIIAMDISEGIQERRITDNLHIDNVVDWNKNEYKLLIQSEVRLDGSIGHFRDLYTINADGTAKQLVLSSDSTLAICNPRFSPSGKHIAFTCGENNNIYVANSDGSDIRKVTNSSLNEYDVSWLPSGKRLVFARQVSEGSSQRHLYTINIDGTELQRITFTAGNYSSPEWRPNRD